MRRYLALFATCIATLGLLVAVDTVSGNAAAPQSTKSPAVITITNFTYTGQLTVTPGQTVKVVNGDGFSHTATNPLGKFDTGTIPSGTFKTFIAPKKPGRYGIKCNFHASMKGTLRVMKPA